MGWFSKSDDSFFLSTVMPDGQAAKEMGADGVIGVSFDYAVLGETNGMMLVSVSGTAVKLGWGPPAARVAGGGLRLAAQAARCQARSPAGRKDDQAALRKGTSRGLAAADSPSARTPKAITVGRPTRVLTGWPLTYLKAKCCASAIGISSITPSLEWQATRALLSKSAQRRKSLSMRSATRAMQGLNPTRRTHSTTSSVPRWRVVRQMSLASGKYDRRRMGCLIPSVGTVDGRSLEPL